MLCLSYEAGYLLSESIHGRQGESGLGHQAQRAAVEQFCQQQGCEVLAEFLEVEGGRKSDRPVLHQALAHAKATRATLLIARPDRLARNLGG